MRIKGFLHWASGAVAAFAVLVHAAGPSAMKNSLYGDPAHPNLSGMWNPEFAYLGPPLGDAPPVSGGGPPGAGNFPPGPPPMPQLTPPYAKRYTEWKKKFDTDGSQDPDSVTRCLAFGMPRFGTMPVEIIQTPGQVTPSGRTRVSMAIPWVIGRATRWWSRPTTFARERWIATVFPTRTS